MFFNEIKKNFGFGCMRLPMTADNNVDYPQFNKMIDEFIDAGFNYFDTAHGYIDKKSEVALSDCLIKRYKREQYLIADKLSSWTFEKKEDIVPFLNKQLKILGVDYVDFYLIHAVSRENYKKYSSCDAFSECLKLKKEGKIRHLGMSFHDTHDILDKILTEHPELEFIQLQFNYLDYDDQIVQSRKCYEVARKHNKPVFVMEPVKGGSLVNLPPKAQDEINKLDRSVSNAGYAVRFAASFVGVEMVLSGMSSIEQMRDNLKYMTDFKPVTDFEKSVLFNVRNIILEQNLIKCTSCEYCVAGCPQNIMIPALFACYNKQKSNKNFNGKAQYAIYTEKNGKASDCIKCGKCEKECPQMLKIRDLLKDVAETFES